MKSVKRDTNYCSKRGKKMGNRFIAWLKAFRPPLVGSIVGTVLFAGLSVAFIGTTWFQYLPGFISYVIFVCAAVFLALATWAITLFLMNSSLKELFLEVTGRNQFTKKLTRDFTYRTMITSSGSLAFNVIFSVSKIAAGWYYSSIWLMVLAGYYLILCISKALLLRFGRKQMQLTDETEVTMHEWKAYRLCGILLLVMTAFLQGVVIMIVRDGTGFSYHEIVVITIAAYDFYCLGNAIYYMIARRKNHSPFVNSLKMLSLAASLVAILSLQTAMFSSFGGADEADFKSWMNILTGTFVCVFLIVLGILSIRRANLELKRIKNG